MQDFEDACTLKPLRQFLWAVIPIPLSTWAPMFQGVSILKIVSIPHTKGRVQRSGSYNNLHRARCFQNALCVVFLLRILWQFGVGIYCEVKFRWSLCHHPRRRFCWAFLVMPNAWNSHKQSAYSTWSGEFYSRLAIFAGLLEKGILHEGPLESIDSSKLAFFGSYNFRDQTTLDCQMASCFRMALILNGIYLLLRVW